LAANKKPAGAYHASGPMSANFAALLKPPRARSCAVMVMMTVMAVNLHLSQTYVISLIVSIRSSPQGGLQRLAM